LINIRRLNRFINIWSLYIGVCFPLIFPDLFCKILNFLFVLIDGPHCTNIYQNYNRLFRLVIEAFIFLNRKTSKPPPRPETPAKVTPPKASVPKPVEPKSVPNRKRALPKEIGSQLAEPVPQIMRKNESSPTMVSIQLSTAVDNIPITNTPPPALRKMNSDLFGNNVAPFPTMTSSAPNYFPSAPEPQLSFGPAAGSNDKDDVQYIYHHENEESTNAPKGKF